MGPWAHLGFHYISDPNVFVKSILRDQNVQKNPMIPLLVGGLEHFLFFHFIYGMSSFPLTFIFFKMVKTTNQGSIISKKNTYIVLRDCPVDNSPGPRSGHHWHVARAAAGEASWEIPKLNEASSLWINVYGSIYIHLPAIDRPF